MSNDRAPINRRKFLQSSALGAAAAASGTLAAPQLLRAQGAGVKLGVLHPVSGALSYSGQQGRLGARIAIEEINAGGGIKALGGAKIDPVLGDAQSTPEGGNAEVEKMNAAGVAAVVGGYASSICLAASQTAARYDLPYIVDVGVVDSIVSRGLKNTFRFGPGFGVIAKTALDNLVILNDQAGKPAKTVMIVNEDSLFGSGLAKLLNAQLPDRGFRTLALIVFASTAVFNLATYNYYRGSVVTAFHGGPVSPAKHHLALAAGGVLPDGSVRFHAYLDGGTPAAPSNIMAATLVARDGSVLEQWDGAALSHLPPSMIANEFAYNRFTPGPFGLSAKMGAEATITLPGQATAGPDIPGKAATLRLRTVNGNRFELPLKTN